MLKLPLDHWTSWASWEEMDWRMNEDFLSSGIIANGGAHDGIAKRSASLVQ